MSVANASADSLWIICEVDDSVLNSLEISRFCVLLIEHAVLPSRSGLPAETSRTFVGLKLTPVVSILDKEVHMLGDMNMDDDWSIILHIELQIVEIFKCIPHFFDPRLKCGFDFIVFFLGFEDHVLHGIHLQGSHPCAGIELQVFQCLLPAFYQVALHCPRQELHSAIDTFLHTLLLFFL